MNDPVRYGMALDATVYDPALLCPSMLNLMIRGVAKAAEMRLLHVITSDIEKDLTRLGEQQFADEGGTSVIGLLSTSHVTVHAWDERSMFMFDLVSCREFEPTAVRAYITACLGVDKELHYVLDWPDRRDGRVADSAG